MTNLLKGYIAGVTSVIILALVLFVVVLLQGHRAGELREERDAAIAAVNVLKARGFHAPAGPAKVPDLPAPAKPVASLRGRVSYGPPTHPPGAAADPAVPLAPDERKPAAAPGLPPFVWKPTPADLRGGCRAELVKVGERPLARLWWEGAVRLEDGSEVTRGPELVDDVDFGWTLPVQTSAPRALAGAMVLLSVGPGGPGGLALGELAPKSWAVSGRLAEGRFKIVGGLEQLPGETRYLGGVGFIGGMGKR